MLQVKNFFIKKKRMPDENILALLFIFILFGCESDLVNPKLNEEFEIKYGESLKIENENLKIKFLSVISDSRCPEGAICKWAGNAEIKFQVNSEEIILNTFLKPNEKEVSGYLVKLLQVSPLPKENQQIRFQDYKCKIIIAKK